MEVILFTCLTPKALEGVSWHLIWKFYTKSFASFRSVSVHYAPTSHEAQIEFIQTSWRKLMTWKLIQNVKYRSVTSIWNIFRYGVYLSLKVSINDLFISPWRKALLEKLKVNQMCKKCPAFYEIRRFITVFTRVGHRSISWARCIQSTTSHRFPKIHSNIIFLSKRRSSEWSLPFRFSDQNAVEVSHLYHAK